MVLNCGYAANLYIAAKCYRFSKNCGCNAIAETSKYFILRPQLGLQTAI